MRYGDITRGDRVLHAVTGEVTAGPMEVYAEGSGQYGYTYTYYVEKHGVKMLAGHFRFGRIVDDLDVDVSEVVPGEPSSLPVAIYPPVYYGPDGNPVGDGLIRQRFEYRTPEQLGFAPKPYRHDPEADLGGDRWEADFYERG